MRATAAWALALVLLGGSAVYASTPAWNDIQTDPNAFSYTMGHHTEDWTSGSKHGTYHWYIYRIRFNGTSLLSSIPASQTVMDWFDVYDDQPGLHADRTTSLVNLPGGSTTAWSGGYTPDELLTAYWRSPGGTPSDPGKYMLHSGDDAIFGLRVNQELPDAGRIAIHAKGWTPTGSYKGAWLKGGTMVTAPEPATLTLLCCAGGVGLLLRRKRRRG